MPNPMYRFQLPTEKLRDKCDELKNELEELGARWAEEKDDLESKISGLEDIVDDLNDRITELEERDRVLTTLENAGVNNWEGYDIAMDQLR